MEKMKESNILWIGKIPSDWKIVKLKYLIESNDGGIWGDDPVSDDEIDKIVIRSTEQTIDGNWQIDKPAKRNLKGLNYSFYRIEKNDLLMTKSSGSNFHIGKTTLANEYFEENECYYSNFLQRIRIINALPQYIWYILNSNISRAQFVYMQNSTSGIGNINADNINNLYIAYPSINQQKKIVKFLDEKLSKIDNAINKTKNTIEDYKKYKEAKITQISLTGLKKNELKESGIDWIGKIPANWKIKSFKNVMNERNEKNNPIQTEERLSLSIDKGITLYAEKTTNLDRFKDDCSQYKLAHKGDLVFNSMNMIVGATGYSKYFGCVSPVYYTFYDNTNNHITAKYYEYVFKTKTVKRVLYSMGKGIMSIDRGDDKVNTCRLKISRDDLRTFKVPVPPIDEQNQIVSYLDKKCSEIDNLILNKEKILEELEQYKKSLIYEYVTGKKEVI